jgi:hypothetical protein
MEGVIVLHKMIHEMHKRKQSGLIMKIDFKKAYDKIKWDFIQEVMERKGFPPTWTEQTMNNI